MNLNLDYLVTQIEKGITLDGIILTSVFVEVIIINGNHYEFILN